MASLIGQYRRKVALGLLELTQHAKDEMEADGFGVADVKSAIYTGRVTRRQRHDAGVRKCVVRGRARDGRTLCVVVRLTELGRLRAITVFAD